MSQYLSIFLIWILLAMPVIVEKIKLASIVSLLRLEGDECVDWYFKMSLLLLNHILNFLFSVCHFVKFCICNGCTPVIKESDEITIFVTEGDACDLNIAHMFVKSLIERIDMFFKVFPYQFIKWLVSMVLQVVLVNCWRQSQLNGIVSGCTSVNIPQFEVYL